VGEPGFHRGALVGGAEVGEHGVAGADVLEVALDDLGRVALGAPAVVPAHRVDRVPASLAQKLRGTPPILVRERWPGEIGALHDAHARMRSLPGALRLE
jgi:hypothetical protein